MDFNSNESFSSVICSIASTQHVLRHLQKLTITGITFNLMNNQRIIPHLKNTYTDSIRDKNGSYSLSTAFAFAEMCAFQMRFETLAPITASSARTLDELSAKCFPLSSIRIVQELAHRAESGHWLSKCSPGRQLLERVEGEHPGRTEENNVVISYNI